MPDCGLTQVEVLIYRRDDKMILYTQERRLKTDRNVCFQPIASQTTALLALLLALETANGMRSTFVVKTQNTTPTTTISVTTRLALAFRLFRQGTTPLFNAVLCREHVATLQTTEKSHCRWRIPCNVANLRRQSQQEFFDKHRQQAGGCRS